MKTAADLISVTKQRVRNLTTQMVVPTLLVAVIAGILLAGRVATMTAQTAATPTITVAIDHRPARLQLPFLSV
jgi:hypothetical protein